jgi:anti-sigma regulatory factor (Ser/Thr protein kinase)
LIPRLDSPGLGLGLPILAKVADEVSLRSRERGGTEVAMRFSL